MKYLLFIFSFFISSSIFSQKRQPPPPGSSEPKRIGGTKFSLQKRLAFYPFNKATQIKLVSFIERIDSSIKNPDENTEWGIPITNDTNCFSKLEEIKAINLKQIDTLTDILYNECLRWDITIRSIAQCYYPRNAIIFFDDTGNVFEYIEICFECRNEKYSSKNVEEARFCDYSFEKLEKFFKKLGLKTTEAEFINKN